MVPGNVTWSSTALAFVVQGLAKASNEAWPEKYESIATANIAESVAIEVRYGQPTGPGRRTGLGNGLNGERAIALSLRKYVTEVEQTAKSTMPSPLRSPAVIQPKPPSYEMLDDASVK